MGTHFSSLLGTRTHILAHETRQLFVCLNGNVSKIRFIGSHELLTQLLPFPYIFRLDEYLLIRDLRSLPGSIISEVRTNYIKQHVADDIYCDIVT